MKKISVIIPVFNVEKYLEECLESVINQTWQEIEILAVDDGSTDNSLEILERYKEKYPDKIKVFTKKNGGQGSARNVALKYVSGEFVGFVDADDWIDPDMYKEMIQLAEKEQTDVVICDMVDHYPDKDVYHNSSQFNNRFKVTPSACNKIFRKNIVDGKFFPEGLWYEDFEFTTKILMETKRISVIHKGFYHCHCREISTMNNNNSVKNLDMLQVFEHLYLFLRQKEWLDKYNETMEYLVLYHILITSINRVARQKNLQKNDVIKRMRIYVLKKYPRFWKDKVFKEFSNKQQIIACLNGFGLQNVSQQVFRWKDVLKNRWR